MTAETSNARGEWVLVPREPTEAMIDAWRDAPDIWEDAYAAMLAVAPPPAAARGDVRYDRELIAQMLDAAEAPAFTMEEMDAQARLLREAAQAKPEARGGGEVVAWMTPSGDVSRSFYWCLERCLPGQEPQPLYAAPQQPAAPSGEAGAFDANFLQSVASLCRAAYDLCQPKPQRTPEDAREHYGELCLLELTSIADEIERRLAAADAAQRQEPTT